MKPVYVVNGFLESGKTDFIKYTISQPYFQSKGTTLIILCEEGESEYEEELLKKTHSILEFIEEEEDFTPQNLVELEKKYKPERILIEYNGMWNYKEMKLPWHWKIEQQITMIDGSTFSVYFTNMRSLLAEMLRKSELIIMNRCDGIKDIPSYKRNIKALNQQAEIVFEDSNGEVNATMEEELPFDIHQDVIKLDNLGYGIWYLDMLDNLERYHGKTVEFIARAMCSEELPKGSFVPGRLAMTCCADDMAFLGFPCKYDGAGELENKEWVKVTARIQIEYWEDYQGEGPVLYADSVEKTKAPEDEIISFV